MFGELISIFCLWRCICEEDWLSSSLSVLSRAMDTFFFLFWPVKFCSFCCLSCFSYSSKSLPAFEPVKAHLLNLSNVSLPYFLYSRFEHDGTVGTLALVLAFDDFPVPVIALEFSLFCLIFSNWFLESFYAEALSEMLTL